MHHAYRSATISARSETSRTGKSDSASSANPTQRDGGSSRRPPMFTGDLNSQGLPERRKPGGNLSPAIATETLIRRSLPTTAAGEKTPDHD